MTGRAVHRLRQQRGVLLALLFAATLNASGQMLFKVVRAAAPGASLPALFRSPWLWIALAVYGLSALLWLWVLSRAHLSFAYPVLALTYPIVVGLAALLFDEPVSPVRWLGVGLIVVGISLMASTGTPE